MTVASLAPAGLERGRRLGDWLRGRARSLALVRDLCCVLFLGLVAAEVYFSRVESLPMTTDSFLKAYLLHIGEFPSVIVEYEPHLNRFLGRPIRGLPWNLAYLIGGGSSAGYYVFMYWCVLLSAVLMYVLARMLFPGYGAWAFAAAALKLVWPADHEIFGHNTLTNQFGETAFWVAAILLALLLRGTSRPPRPARWLLCLLMAACVVVSMGGYESGWAVTLAMPLAVAFATRARWRAPETLAALGAWYAAGLFVVGWWAFSLHRYGHPHFGSTPRGLELVATFGGRGLAAVKGALLDPIVIATSSTWRWLVGLGGGPLGTLPAHSRWLVVGFAVLFPALFAWLARAAEPRQAAAGARGAGRRLSPRSIGGRLALCGLVAIWLGVLLAAAKGEPRYGSRYLHWAAPGAVMVALAPLVWLAGTYRARGAAAGGLALTVLFGSATLYKDALGETWARTGAMNNRRWQELMVKVPSVTEGTVVVMESCPHPESYPDHFSSFAFRTLTATRSTFLFCEGDPQIVERDDGYGVKVQTRLTLEPAGGRPKDHLRSPPILPRLERQERVFDGDRVIWLKWRADTRGIEVVESRSALARLEASGFSAFGRQLFPAADPRPWEPVGSAGEEQPAVAEAPVGPVDAAPTGRLEPVAKGLDQPVYVTHAGDGSGRLFVVEKKGRVVVLQPGAERPTVFLDLGRRVRWRGKEQGLLSVAFHPRHVDNGLFYVYYTNRRGDPVIARYGTAQHDRDVADPTSGKVLLTVDQEGFHHNGGLLLFGPDGYLYAGLGEGVPRGDRPLVAQDRSTLLGKLLRIDVDSGSPYVIPADNPFVGEPGARPEIWASGLRNPWRFAFDRATGDLYIADVGQGTSEEINLQRAGARGGQNYGWRQMEGAECFPPGSACDPTPFVAPVATYPHSLGCAIVGGHVYRGPSFPELHGLYLYADFCSGAVWGLREQTPGQWEQVELLRTGLQAGISSFGEDEAGEPYLTSLSDGTLYRLVAAP